MKKMLLFTFFIITSLYVQGSDDDNKIPVDFTASIVSHVVYSAHIVLSQLTFNKDREKRLQFCLWETQNLIKESKQVKTDEELNNFIKKFETQMQFCVKLVTFC